MLEGLFNLCSAGHLFVHLRLEEGAPELLSKEVLIHLQLIAIFVVISGLITDLLLTQITLHTPLECSLLIVQRFEHGGKSVLSLEVILVNKPHELLQSVLRLQPRLLGLPVLFGLIHVYLLLILMAFTLLVEPDLNRYQVRLHAVDHVLVRTLDHQLTVMRVLDIIKLGLRVVETLRLSAGCIFNRSLVALGLLKLTLHSHEKVMSESAEIGINKYMLV